MKLFYVEISGAGKTLLVKTLARFIDVPIVIADATCLTQAGYVGEDVESILLKLYHEAGQDLERCQKGIVYIDEADKIRKSGGNISISRDVSGEGVQHALLKIVEGNVINVPKEPVSSCSAGCCEYCLQLLSFLHVFNISVFFCFFYAVGTEKPAWRLSGNRYNQRIVHLWWGLFGTRENYKP